MVFLQNVSDRTVSLPDDPVWVLRPEGGIGPSEKIHLTKKIFFWTASAIMLFWRYALGTSCEHDGPLSVCLAGRQKTPLKFIPISSVSTV